ncbi:UDP-2,3-diacylglucosamine diphosphatase [Sinisalibacter aestuarii]|uniref:UDP-2,3-diacylglucosamine hydrolase n=1 Tax=Sinisalibacter aestuarii TaxID=2949426 RepID=A0ABQ5LND9_9RHOB|nr:UDP-2,3-diacylglucosamine diphosphatase [Sinisalibacter aestuarii]GKY86525.1 UDP-2,3-diacylglucosamine hydrolase [Sinisalibacter aestuarii]
MSSRAQPPMPRQMRSLFLSDFHLGARACRPREILDFLYAHEAETIYLVGDIFDLWHGGHIHWTPVHDAVIGELERRARSGVRVIYLAGNHDAPFRKPGAMKVPSGWELREAVAHRAADERRYLVLHGDQCDPRFLRWHWMTRLGSRADAAIRGLDAWLGRRLGRRDPGRSQTTLERLISTFNGLFVMGGAFERRLVALAGAAGMQGVICGHSHKPGLHKVGETLFANCGDWVDSFTALAEDESGSLHLIEWASSPFERPAPRPLAEPGMVGGERI